MCGYVPSRDFDFSSPNSSFSSSCPAVGGLESKCRPVKDCAVWYDLVLATPDAGCALADGGPGACCPDLPANSYGAPPLQENEKKAKQYNLVFNSPKQQFISGNIDKFSVNSAAEAGRLEMKVTDTIETQLFEHNIFVLPGSSRATHALVFTSTAESEKMSRDAMIEAYTVTEIVKRFNIKPEDVERTLRQFNLKDTILSGTCTADPVCDEKTIRSPYRTLDGSCNNIQRPSWGKSLTQFQRALPSAYADGVRTPRRAKNGGELPSARLVSTTVARDIDSPSQTDTTWVMQYGQFIDHDFTKTPEFKMANGSTIPCCMPDGKFIEKKLIHPECFPIEIPENDSFFSKFGQRCMPLVRSAPIRRLDCTFGASEQMNQFTHFLDQSNVYGFDDKTARELRTFEKGGMKVTPRDELDLLPADEESKVSCTLSKTVSGIDPPTDVKCFKTGDTPRVNEHPNLAVTHTIFLREHNRLAAELARLNPGWDDERLYQEAKRILAAQMQHITYNEWLPIIIGRVKMQELGLLPLQQGPSQDYDKNLNPSVLNEFAAAAFRFGHTLIQGKHHLTNQRRIKEREILLRQHFFKMQEIYTPGNLDKFLIGLASQPSQNAENYFTQEVTNHLFEEQGKGFGLDLVSLNLQRGRDHGIPGYNAYRTQCGLPPAGQFSDLLNLISPAIVDKFAKLYDTVDDIDLFIGAMSERLAPGALVGHTFQCIIADQFLKFKRGDRFFYDLAGQPSSFTEDQLTEIRRASFARLVCDNSNVKSSQPLIFKTPSHVNPILNCDSGSIPRLNLRPFGVEDRWPEYNTGDGGVKWLQNCDFPGYDLSRKTIPGEQCGRLCINDGKCNAFTHNSATGICFLKDIPASYGRSPWDGAICGFLPWKF
ncbi:peroxidase-like [Daphnia pulex]|uniref:peroxidase-like n=1 Tax=Daphnia pulex TaxID=6669 RepID=UPI001EDF414D|nr:peroxidase-like [Daphnia pulex]